ncbi:hypothetical protein GQ44DRAFT_769209 [Phaeosphaeriaceae sp. PMI808]|nr:hypothetical protein GQ44DRAFT_769209 [Phaeosphaeriaceae sp. PMI808]
MKTIQHILALIGGCTICAQASLSQQQCAQAQQHVLSNQGPICHEKTHHNKPPIIANKPFTHPTWSHEPFCISEKGKKYCTYTTADFRTSHGLSIISTPAAADAVASAFPLTKAARHVSEKNLIVKALPGKGYGLITTTRISKGSSILLDSPRIIASAQFPAHVLHTQGASLFAHALSGLPRADRTLVLGLDKSLGGSDIEDIMKTNAFACQIEDGGEADAYMCLFPSVARINHACRPNAHARFVPRTMLMEIKALRDIGAGEEISISYGKVDLMFDERQKLYKEGWSFECSCEKCVASMYDRAGSDQRIARFAQLRQKLENLTPATYDAPQIVAWEKEVMELGTKEGLEVLLAADYERLAYVYAGSGMARDAKLWANKARESLLEWTVVEGGPDNEVRRLEALLSELRD